VTGKDRVETKKPRLDGARDDPRREDDVATLLVAAGPRPDDDAVRERVKTTVRARWRTTVRARAIRRRWFLVAHLTAAALAAAVVVSLMPFPPGGLPDARTAAPAPDAARVEAVLGAGLSAAGAGGARPERLRVGDPIRPGAILATGAGAGAALRTVDGVSIRIGGGTRLRLLSPTELVLDEGRVYIDNPPATTPRHRLAVRTPLGTVRDAGTQFEAALDGADLRVRVREGAVSLARADGADETTAGTEMRVSPDGRVERRAFPAHGPEWAWATELAAPIDIEGRPLGEFLAWVTREMGWRVSFADEALAVSSAGIVLHGSISGLTPDEARATVLATCGLTSRLTGETLVIEDLTGERRP